MILLTSFVGSVWSVDSLPLPLDHCCPFSLALYRSMPKNITAFFGPARESHMSILAPRAPHLNPVFAGRPGHWPFRLYKTRYFR